MLLNRGIAPLFSLAVLLWPVAGATQTAREAAAGTARVAAAGRVEPKGEERVVIAESSGRLKRVLIEDGDKVTRGQLLAEVENAEQLALVQQAQAQTALRQAELERLRNGAREEERRMAAATLSEAEATLHVRRAERERRETLYARQQIGREARDEAVNQHALAEAALTRAQAQMQQIDKGARKEDLAIAEAALAAARAELARSEALLEKTRIRSPVDGVVLKRELREGEMVTALNPLPLARIGDVSQLYVRAEIDELDLTRVKVGDHASVRSDAFPKQVYKGRVERLSRRMGNRVIKTDNPAEKEDTRVLEALIRLDGNPALPIGLRVDVTLTSSSP